jgi:cell division septum initiation protein DivIVA
LENESAPNENEDSVPVFTSNRRGYDPEQVDAYIADQERRVQVAAAHASEAERKLTAAVGQLRELHRRITALETADRIEKMPALDTIGEQIQRILQDAWDGAYALRQTAEKDAAQLREQAQAEADETIEKAHRRAEAVGVELARRREAFLERIEQERSKAVAQTTFLQGQRKLALGELEKLRSLIDATVDEFNDESALPAHIPDQNRREDVHVLTPSAASETRTPMRMTPATAAIRHPANSAEVGPLARTMPVHRLSERESDLDHDASALVRSHREQQSDEGELATIQVVEHDQPRGRPALFDFAATEDDEDR